MDADEAQEIEERRAPTEAAEDFEDDKIGPLMGGYRPSSLRLIDEAVAAAQAIEPSLFDELLDEQLRAPGDAHASNGAAEPEPRPADVAVGRPAALESAAHLRAAEREESGLRMIGSLGRDRAEASGELAPLNRARPLRSETARELVTILPRRATREMPVVSQEIESLPTPTPTSPVLTPRPSATHEAVTPGVTASQRISLPGSGVTAVSRSNRLLRLARSDEGGPGLGPLLLIALAVVLAVTAVVLRLRRSSPQPPPGQEQRVSPPTSALPPTVEGAVGESPATAPSEAGAHGSAARSSLAAGSTGARAGTLARMSDEPRGGNGVGTGTSGEGNTVARVSGEPRAEAGGGTTAAGHDTDAGDAGARSAGRLEAERLAQAKILYDKGQEALQAGDVQRALTQAEASLKLRKTARTYMLRAQAEQRLDRTEASLASVAAAAQLAPDLSAVWELRGRILWAARRREEARVAFAKFLRLDPNSSKAPPIRRLMNDPR